MDAALRRLVEADWATRLGLPLTALHRGGVQVVSVAIGANDAMSFLLGDTCIVVVAADDAEAARTALAGVSAADAFTADALRKILGPDARVDGPSVHSYVSRRTFRGARDPTVTPIDGGDPSL